MATAKKKTANDPVVEAIRAATEQFESGANTLKGGLDAALDASAEQARAACAFEGVGFAGRENVDAAVQAGDAYFAGLKDLNDLWFQAAKDAARFNMGALQTLSGCKTPEALSEAQQKIASEGLEAAKTAADTFGTAVVKTADAVSAPLNTSFSGPFAQFWGKTAA